MLCFFFFFSFLFEIFILLHHFLPLIKDTANLTLKISILMDFSAVNSKIWWLNPKNPLFLWQHCSLTPSLTALLRMCTVSHPLPPHAHPALTIQSTAPHSLSMHKKLNCTLPPTPLWCSCRVTMLSI